MINTSVNKNEHTIQSGVVDYPIGFPFYFNPDRTPQLLVKIGNEELRFNHNFELSEDKGSVVLRPTEEESWTLEGPEDFSWMTKWDGKDLLIERAVPFVQDSDYQLGRISSEQIERDFDLSVMRDQALVVKNEQLRKDIGDEFREVRDEFAEADRGVSNKIDIVEAELQRSIDDKLPLSGGLLTGQLTIKVDTVQGPVLSLKNEAPKTFDFYANGTELWMNFKIGQVEGISPANTYSYDLGDWLYRWRTVYAKELSNGFNKFIAIPEKTGTLACLDDIPETYTKEELDRKFAEIPEAVDAYTKAEVDAKLSSDYATIVYAEDLYFDLHGKLDKEIAKRSSEDTQLYNNQIVLRDMLNEKDENGEYIKLTTEAQTAIPAINELNAKIGEGGGGASLPDQTGNAGKVLVTDGENVSWSLGTIRFTNRTASYESDGSVIITVDGQQGLNKIGRGSVIVGGHNFGQPATAKNATVVGVSSNASSNSIAIGYRAAASASYSIQLGQGTNLDANTFKVSNENGNFEMMSADGTIPAERMSAAAGTTGQVLTKTNTGMAWQDVSGGGGDTIQFEQLPTPSADYAGKILQYVGEDGVYKSGHFYKCVETADIMGMGYTMDGTQITVTVDTQKFLAQNPVWADYGMPTWRADGGGGVWNVWTQDPSLSLTDDELRNTWGVAVNTSDGSPYTGDNASITVQNMGTTYAWVEVELGGGGEGPDLSNYLQLSGGTMTGPITLGWSGPQLSTRFVAIKSKYLRESNGSTYAYNLLEYDPAGMAYFYGNITSANLIPKAGSNNTIGTTAAKWFRVHTQSLWNGGILHLPTTGGTIARVEDIDAAVGDISTALTAILGE